MGKTVFCFLFGLVVFFMSISNSEAEVLYELTSIVFGFEFLVN